MQKKLSEHFSSEVHSGFLDNVSVICIDKADPEDHNKREHDWRHTLKTMAPQALYVEDVDSCSFVLFMYPILLVIMTFSIKTSQFGC